MRGLSGADLAHKVQAHDVAFVLVGPSVHGEPNRLDEQGRRMLSMLRERPRRYRPAFADTNHAIFIFVCADRTNPPPTPPGIRLD